MDFKSYLSQTAEELDREIGKILGDWLRQVKRISPKLVPLAKSFIKACEGGKRIRGTLVKLGYEMTRSVILNEVKDLSRMRPSNRLRDSSLIAQNDILRIGAAYEIFHAAILAHDDIIDLSPLRRGQPTLYKTLGGDHYGISQTIALADCGFFLTVKIMADANFPPQQKARAISYFSQTIVDTGLGEVLDVEVPHLGGERREEDVITIHNLKTAQYTISGPLIMGAILGGLGPTSPRLRGIKEFGENLGIAFQIQDDILGVFGDVWSLGKSVTSDIEEGKNTLLITEALKRANPDQRKILDRYYGQGSQGSRGLEKVRQVFKETGALDYSRQEGVKYVTRAKKLIAKITQKDSWAKMLSEMADFLVERSK